MSIRPVSPILISLSLLLLLSGMPRAVASASQGNPRFSFPLSERPANEWLTLPLEELPNQERVSQASLPRHAGPAWIANPVPETVPVVGTSTLRQLLWDISSTNNLSAITRPGMDVGKGGMDRMRSNRGGGIGGGEAMGGGMGSGMSNGKSEISTPGGVSGWQRNNGPLMGRSGRSPNRSRGSGMEGERHGMMGGTSGSQGGDGFFGPGVGAGDGHAMSEAENPDGQSTFSLGDDESDPSSMMARTSRFLSLVRRWSRPKLDLKLSPALRFQAGLIGQGPGLGMKFQPAQSTLFSLELQAARGGGQLSMGVDHRF